MIKTRVRVRWPGSQPTLQRGQQAQARGPPARGSPPHAPAPASAQPAPSPPPLTPAPPTPAPRSPTCHVGESVPGRLYHSENARNVRCVHGVLEGWGVLLCGARRRRGRSDLVAELLFLCALYLLCKPPATRIPQLSTAP
eukprot:2613074-Rhodomonas_salina.2